jgi:hypothetical protein
VLQTVHSVPWQSLSFVDTYVMVSTVDPFYLASVTIVCFGYYLSPWWSLSVVIPLPCTVVIGVFVVHHLLCTVEVIGFFYGPSNWHHGSLYCLSVEPYTLYLRSHLWLCGPISLLHGSHNCLLWALYCMPWWSMASMVHPFTLYHGGHWCLLLTCYLEPWGSLV